MNKIVIIFMSFSFILCQPGKARGPGGQYQNRMETMMVWKLTDYLNLSEQQAEKLFPRMRRHRIRMGDLHTEEKDLFDSYLSKIKKEDLENILKSGIRVPDHGAISPWKLILLDLPKIFWTQRNKLCL